MPGSTPTGIMPTGSTALVDQVRRVEVLRQEAGRFGLALTQRRAKFDADNASLLNAVGAIKEKLAEEEIRLRDMAVAEFNATGEKKPAPGVSIKEMIDLVYDKEKAFAWAKEKGMALALDQKAFVAIAKHTELDFVKKLPSPQATIAKDLAILLRDHATLVEEPAAEAATAAMAADDEEAPF